MSSVTETRIYDEKTLKDEFRIATVLSKLKKSIQRTREQTVKEKVEQNQLRMIKYLDHLTNVASTDKPRSEYDPIRCVQTVVSSFENEKVQLDIFSGSETNCASESEQSVLYCNAVPVRFVSLSQVDQRPPRFTTWVFVDRNKWIMKPNSIRHERNRMQLIMSQESSQEMSPHGENAVKNFTNQEDYLIWMAYRTLQTMNRIYIHKIAELCKRNPDEIQARFEEIHKDEALQAECDRYEKITSVENSLEQSSRVLVKTYGKSTGVEENQNLAFLEDVNSLTKMVKNMCGDDKLHQETTLDFEEGRRRRKENERKVDWNLDKEMNTFNNLFCRRCLVFNCQLHGPYQPIIYAIDSETQQSVSSKTPQASNPCCPQCYLLEENLKKEQGSGSFLDGGRGAWTLLEETLFKKGLQIFGRSSCLIAKNLLQRCKTCNEVATKISTQGLDHGEIPRRVQAADQPENRCLAKISGGTYLDITGSRVRTVKRKLGRRKRLSGIPAKYGRRNRDGEYALCRQFTPCGCLVCEKECPCRNRKTHCEKYCGCARECRNRFPGCSCSKSHCGLKFCPCFAAERECDPDVCRNCPLDCGDRASGGPSTSKAMEQSRCRNMKLLQGQHQAIAIARSDVSGWGAFLKGSVKKDDILGEYAGELISHFEADRRGKIYDQLDCSFLFNLNDKYVLDAFRIGNKLKFLNHSSMPNCYAKVILVGSEHKVGIFAKRNIHAGQELCFDYEYEKLLGDRTPSWARSIPSRGSENSIHKIEISEPSIQ